MSFGFSISDIIAVGELSFRLYRECYQVARGAPQEFQLVINEMSNLSNSIKILQNEVKDPKSTLVQAGEDRVRMVNGMMTGIMDTLKALEKVAKKYEILGSASQRKKIWARFKWSAELVSIEKLRGKLVYHNGVMNLLLTSIGNSSLQRIESTNTALARDINIIKSLIAGRQVHTVIPTSTSPLGVGGDDILQERLNAKLMKNAEVDQPWSTIGIAQWVACARWWLLVAQLELVDVTEVAHETPLSAYSNLVKTSWILINMIAPHPQIAFTTATTQADVRLLSTELKGDFSKLDNQKIRPPSLNNVEKQILQVWERQTSDSVALPVKEPNVVDRWRIGGDEEVLFQSYGSYQRGALTESLPCLILLLIARDCKSARLVAQSQNGVCILVYSIEQDTDLTLEGTWALLGYSREPGFDVRRTYKRYRISLVNERAAKLFSCFVKAVSFYVFEQNVEVPSPADLPAYAMLFAVKDMDIDITERLKKRIVPSISYSRVDGAGRIAMALADNLINPESDESTLKNIPSHIIPTDSLRPTSRLFIWAAYNGLVPLLHIMITNRIEWTDLEFPDGQRYSSDHSGVFCLINCCKNFEVAEMLFEDFRQTWERQGLKGTDIIRLAQSGLVRSVDMFLDRLSPRDKEHIKLAESVLVAAVNAREILILKRLLRAGFSTESKDARSNTLLMIAVQHTETADRVKCYPAYDYHDTAEQDYEIISLLLTKGASTVAKNYHRLASPHIASILRLPSNFLDLVWQNYFTITDPAISFPNEQRTRKISKIKILLPGDPSIMTTLLFLETNEANFMVSSTNKRSRMYIDSRSVEFGPVYHKQCIDLDIIYPSFLENLDFSLLRSTYGSWEGFPSGIPFDDNAESRRGEAMNLTIANGTTFKFKRTDSRLYRFRGRTDPNAKPLEEGVDDELL